MTLILNIFSAFVIEAFILEYSVTSQQDGKQPLSSLQQRIAAIGLAYGKTEKVKAKVYLQIIIQFTLFYFADKIKYSRRQRRIIGGRFHGCRS